MDFQKIEQKWTKKWQNHEIFKATEKSNKPKYYVLDMFPYPSGTGLHIGHAFVFSLGDIFARFKRMQGHNVLYPIGYDALGLPAENAAIKAGTHPEDYTKKSIANFMLQQKAMGWSYDWSRMVNTSTPEFYKWDQWIFLKMLEKGIAYRKKAPVNWCSVCQTVLANEQVVNGKCWRHEDTEVEIKHLEQWFFRITDYAEELLDYSKLDWPERAKTMQRNWIGRKEWIDIDYSIEGTKEKITVSTTRPDTNFGATFVVMAPEHPLLSTNRGLVPKEYRKKVDAYIKKTAQKTELERLEEAKKKTGTFTGLYCVNQLTKKKMPIWITDFVMMSVGTGAVVGVPGHDMRDFEFAKEFDLPIIRVVVGKDKDKSKITKKEQVQEKDGIMINSGFLDGMDIHKATKTIMDYLEKKGWGRKTIRYRLRDWLISRQRYWGTPIPIVYCKDCGIVPVPEKDLPIKLPKDVKFGKGNPLLTNEKWVNTKCPKCKAPAKRETDTMDTFANSSWYYLRYSDPKNKNQIFDPKKANYWAPVDQYIGGPEHITMHLIYFRFYTKFLRDIGLLKFDEPALKYFTQGIVKGSDGEKMSKSRGNVVEPLDTIKKFGADTTRLYLVSNSSPDSDFDWSDAGMESNYKFINKVYDYFKNLKPKQTSKQLESRLHRNIKEITNDIEIFKHNLAVIRIRELFKHIQKEQITKETTETFLKMLHIYCPFVTEELWELLGNKPFITLAQWPKHDLDKIDLVAEYKETLADNTITDIKKVLQLIKIKQPKNITIIISPKWKYTFFLEFKKLTATTRDTKQLIQAFMRTDLKRQGKQITKMIPALLKDPSKLPPIILDQSTELETLQANKEPLEKEFNCKITIEIAESSKHTKANNASPSKPAILIE